MAERTVFLLFIAVFGTFTVHAQFSVFRGTQNVTVLQNLTDLEKLAVAAKSGETHILELTSDVQAAVVQEDVTLNIDCLPWLLQNPDGFVIRWSFIQLDEFGNVANPNQEPQVLPPNADMVPPDRVIVGGEKNRWLNITQTQIVQGAEDPDSRIYICEVCENSTEAESVDFENCNAANYTQVTVGSPPTINEASENFCRDRNDTGSIELGCTVPDEAQPRTVPTRMWFRNGELVYSSIVGRDQDPNPDFFNANPILMQLIFDPNALGAFADGMLFYVYHVTNITMPGLLPPGVTTIEEARQQLFNLAVGNWTCEVNNALGNDSVTYIVRECERTISFENENYTFIENGEPGEVCINNTDLTGVIEVVIRPVVKEVDNPATGGTDFDDGNITLFFNTSSSSRVCFDPRIIRDSVYEGDEQFLLTFGNLPSDEANVGPIEQACITIVDDDSGHDLFPGFY